MTVIRKLGHARPIPLLAKIAATALLVLLVEWLIEDAAALLSVVALGWVATLCLLRRNVLRTPAARVAIGAALLFVLATIDDPSPLGVLLFLIAITLASLLPKRRFDHAFAWALRLFWMGLTAIPQPLRDIARVSAIRRRSTSGVTIGGVAAALALPVVGSALFMALFSSANPLIGMAFAHIALPGIDTVFWRTIVGIAVLLPVWATLRPDPRVTAHDRRAGDPTAWPQPASGTLVLSLATFNVIFAIQNGLDIAFLWSGAPLPDGVTMADYAHRGAYALIVTALLAALFVLVTLKPGSAGAAHPAVRRLVTVWIVQNLMLVASSALRLFDYIQAYAMTVLRLAALAWMGLVAVGLALILWRLLYGRSAAWLINANALAAALVLTTCTIIDLGATAAAWNARVALMQGRAGPPLDLCYMSGLGSSALLSLAELERHARNPVLRDRLAWLRWASQQRTAEGQASWNGWTFRNARRLAAAEAMAGRHAPRLRAAPDGRECDGRLTKAPQR